MGNSKRVCILTSFVALGSRVFYKIAMTLAKADYQVMLIAPHDKHDIVNGVRIIALPKPKNRFQRMLKTNFQILKLALKHRAHVYHFNQPELIPVGIILKLMKKGKIIYEVLEDFPNVVERTVWIPVHFRPLIRSLIKFTEQFSSKFFDALVFPTEGLSQNFPKAQRKCVLTNFPIMFHRDLCINIDKDLRSIKKKFDIIHLGTISPFRLEFMIEVGRLIKQKIGNFKWLFLGISKDSIEWARQVMKDELFKNFYFKEQVPYSEVPKYILMSKVGFNYHPYEPRFNVAIPVKIFEYMYFGLPVVSTALPELVKYLNGEEVGFLLKNNDPHLFAQIVVRLISDEKLARKLGTNGRRLILEKYNWDSVSHRLLELYSDLLKEG